MNNDSDLRRIRHIKKTAKYIGREVAKKKGLPLDELSKYITPKEVSSIIKQYSIKSNGMLFINETILWKIFAVTEQWVKGVMLSKLASDDLFDVYWNSHDNCAIFETKGNKNGKEDNKTTES
jgi:hypothetical protein